MDTETKMKRSQLRKIGKIGNINLDARRKIATQCFELGIEYCELNFPGCVHNLGVAPCHKEKREWYRTRPELLHDRSHWRVGCVHCHEILDNRAKTTKKQSDAIFDTD